MAPSSQWQAVHRCSTVLACVSSQKEENEEIEGEGGEKDGAQRGARTHDPEIKSLMLYRLS